MAQRAGSTARRCILILGLLWVGTSTGSPARAASPAADASWTKAEQWVWQQLLHGQEADLDDNPDCQGQAAPDPKQADAPTWQNKCREVHAGFLHDILTRAPWQEALPHQGIQIDHARIVGDLDLESAKLVRQLWISSSRIEGAVSLRRARTESLIGINRSFVKGQFDATGLHGDSDLLLRGSSFAATDRDSPDSVLLAGARIAGRVNLDGASVIGTLNANALQAGALTLRSNVANKATFKDIVLRNARIGGSVELDGASVSGTLDANTLQAAALYLRSNVANKSSFAYIVLLGARIAGQVDMTGVSVTGRLDADALETGDFFLSSDAGMGNNGSASFDGSINLTFARVGTILDVRGARVAALDLSAAAIAGELALGTLAGQATAWKDKDGHPGDLYLRNAQIGNLADAQEAWPEPNHLHLDGVGIAHLGGFSGQSGKQMRDRGTDWWDGWARRDRDFSPAPYTQLAAAFVAMGDRGAANQIRFRGRQREREALWQEAWRDRPLWPRLNPLLSWFGQTLLCIFAGYGVGGYTFFVLGWVVLFTLTGAAMLWWQVPAARMGHRGRLWCVGASLSRLLPIIEINKEFTDFFKDPERVRLNGRQTLFFSVLGMIGWVLGAILIAAMSGLMQGG